MKRQKKHIMKPFKQVLLAGMRAKTAMSLFVKYYLGIMLKAYNEFESRVEHLKYHNLSKPDRIKAVIDNKVGKITKKEIMELCPDISKVTVERTLTD